MDYYGPRVPIGGGALAGKDPTHVDRAGASLAREMAIAAVRQGSSECLVRVTFAPGVDAPIDVTREIWYEGRAGSGRFDLETELRVGRELPDDSSFSCRPALARATRFNLPRHAT
jgi:hypothetical protein